MRKIKVAKWAYAAVALVLIAVCLAVLPYPNISADAETIKVLNYEDSFDAETIDTSVWQTTGGVKQKVEYAALRMDSLNMWGGYVVYQKQRLDSRDDGFTVEFDADWLNTKSGWTGIFFGNSSYTSMFTGSRYFLHFSAGPIASNGESGSGLRLSPKSAAGSSFAEDDAEKSQFYNSDVWKKGDLSGGGHVVHIKLRFDRAPETTDKHILTFSWRFADESDYAPENEYVFDRVPFDVSGYMGFTTYGTTLCEIRSFKLSVDGQMPVEEKFTPNDISYPSLPSPSASWRCVAVTENNVYCGNICTIDFSGAPNGTITYATELSENAYCTSNFDMNYTVSLGGVTENTYIGSAFGLKAIDAAASSCDFIGFRKDGSKYKLAHLKNGSLVGAETEFDAEGLDLNLRFFGKYGKRVEVYVNGRRAVEYLGVDFNGFTAMAALTPSGSSSDCTATTDNFTLYKYETVFADNGDYRMDFKGRKESIFPDGSVNNEFWFNTRKWVKFGDVTAPYLEINPNSNYMMMNRVRTEAGFAPRAQFGDFIARFDFQVSSIEDNTIMLSPFGLSFGRDNLASDAKTAPGIYFEPVYQTADGRHTITGTRVSGVNITMDSGMASKTLDADHHAFGDSRTWWTCMVVMSNRTAKVYLKKTNDGSEDFGKALATFTDVDAHGYVAVTHNPSGSNYAYYRMTNISVIGTDLLQKESEAVSVAGDFRNGKSDGWTLNELAMTSNDGVQVISGGNIVSDGKYRNFMVQIEFADLQKGFEFKFGSGDDTCALEFDGAYIRTTGLEAADGETSVIMDDFIYERNIVQIEVVGGQVSVSVKGKDDPYDVLGTPIAVFDYAGGVSATSENISVSAIDGASMCVKKISAYSLDAKVDIETEHYVAPAPKDDGGEKNNSHRTMYIAIGVSAGVVVLAASAVTVFLIVRRKHKKNEKNG